MGFFHPVAILFFSRSVFGRCLKHPKLRNPEDKKGVHLCRSTRSTYDICARLHRRRRLSRPCGRCNRRTHRGMAQVSKPRAAERRSSAFIIPKNKAMVGDAIIPSFFILSLGHSRAWLSAPLKREPQCVWLASVAAWQTIPRRCLPRNRKNNNTHSGEWP